MPVRSRRTGMLGSVMAASQSIAVQSLPDWQQVIRSESVDLLSAYDNPRLYFAVPKVARLATRPDGSPEFFLEFFSDQSDPDVDHSLYAMLHMGLEQEGDVEKAYTALSQAHSGVALLPLAFSTGTYCHLECGDSHESVPFAWEGARRAT